MSIFTKLPNLSAPWSHVSRGPVSSYFNMQQGSKPSRKRKLDILAFFLFTGLTLGLQWAAGAYSSEAAHFADESAHFITALLIRDYVTSGFSETPIHYAQRYYVHYPKIAFGMWPPLFHLVLGAWLVPTPDGRVSALLLMGLVLASAAFVLYWCLHDEYGRMAGIFVGMLLICLPLSQKLTNCIMADTLVMLLGVLSALALSRFLAMSKPRYAVLMGVAIGLGCMTKGNSMGALLAPPLAILLTQSFHVLRKPALYWSAAIVVVLGFPFELRSLFLYQRHSSFMQAGWRFSQFAGHFYSSMLYAILGILLCALILIGLLVKAVAIARKERGFELWASMGSLALGVLVFHVVWPQPPDGRYMLAAAAPLLLFVVPAAEWLTRLVQNRIPSAQFRVTAALATIFLVFLISVFHLQRMPQFGFREAAAWVHSRLGDRSLIISDASGEGGYISEMANQCGGNRFNETVVRGSKLLATSDWNGNYYKLTHAGPESALADIEELGIRYIVLDRSATIIPGSHRDQVIQMLVVAPDRLRLVGRVSLARILEIYEVTRASVPPEKKIAYQMDDGQKIGE